MRKFRRAAKAAVAWRQTSLMADFTNCIDEPARNPPAVPANDSACANACVDHLRLLDDFVVLLVKGFRNAKAARA